MRSSIEQSAVVPTLVLLLTLGANGCGKKAIENLQVTGPAVADLHTGAPLTDEECKQFAESLHKAAHDRSAAEFSKLIDWDVILERGTAGIEAPEQTRQGFTKGFRNASQQSGNFTAVVEAVAKGGKYQLLRVHTQEGQKRALMRLLLPENSGVNYHDVVLARRPGGQIRGVDMYIFMTGELLSASIRRSYIAVAAQSNRSLLDRLRGWEHEYVKNLPKIRQMANARTSGRHQQVLDLYKELPPDLKKNKNLLIIRLAAAKDVSDTEYLAAMEEFRAHHPDDACVDMLSIDYYALKNDYAKSLEMIDRVDKAVGGDPYLHVTRAGTHLLAGDFAAAKAAAHKAIEQEPSLDDAYWTLVNISLKEKKFDDTLQHLKTIDEKFKVDFADFTTLPDYAEFVKSPQYQEWLKSRKAK